MSEKTTISLHPDAKERFRQYGEHGDSWTEIVNNVCDILEKQEGSATER